MFQLTQREHPGTSSASLFNPGPRWTGCCLPTLARVTFSTQYANSNANRFQKHPHGQTQKLFFINIFTTLSPVKPTHKINHNCHLLKVWEQKWLKLGIYVDLHTEVNHLAGWTGIRKEQNCKIGNKNV